MKESNSKMKDYLIGRRNKVFELSTKGNSQAEIAKMLQISEPTISRDISYLKNSAKENIKKHIENKLPFEYEQCLQGITKIIQQAWSISDNAQDGKEKLQSLSLAKDCYSEKMNLLTNASLLKDAIKFLETQKEKLSNNTNNNNKNDLEGFTETNTIV